MQLLEVHLFNGLPVFQVGVLETNNGIGCSCLQEEELAERQHLLRNEKKIIITTSLYSVLKAY